MLTPAFVFLRNAFPRGEPQLSPFRCSTPVTPLPLLPPLGHCEGIEFQRPAGGRSGCGHGIVGAYVSVLEGQGQAGVEAVRIQWRFCQQRPGPGTLQRGLSHVVHAGGTVVAATSWVCWKGDVECVPVKCRGVPRLVLEMLAVVRCY